MASVYAAALVGAYSSSAFDLIGASFGAVLASHVGHAARSCGGCPRRRVLIDPPPAVPRDLPLPKMLSSLRTAAMGVLLLNLQVEMGASVLTQFPQLQSLPEVALPCFVAAQLLPSGASKADLGMWTEQYRRLMSVYRQCRHAFHTFSASIEAAARSSDGSPAVLLIQSSERWPTFREMFPGIKEDAINAYGPAASLGLSGKHIAMINRCLANLDATFADALERCAPST